VITVCHWAGTCAKWVMLYRMNSGSYKKYTFFRRAFIKLGLPVKMIKNTYLNSTSLLFQSFARVVLFENLSYDKRDVKAIVYWAPNSVPGKRVALYRRSNEMRFGRLHPSGTWRSIIAWLVSDLNCKATNF